MAHVAAGGGAHGLDPWVETLASLLEAQPEPADVQQALAPMVALGVDVAAALRAIARYEHALEADWHANDWRRSHPEFLRKYALAMFAYTLQDPNIYRPLGTALHAADRDVGPGGVSEAVRVALPFAKLLDVALVEAVRVWGAFIGQVFRGVKHAFPEPIVATHDPEGYFPPGRELSWFEFNSSSTRFDVMYREWFRSRSQRRSQRLMLMLMLWLSPRR